VTASSRTTADGLALHALLEAVFRELDLEGVRWCLLRGVDELHAPAGDVDILVAPNDLGRLHRVVSGLGFARMPAWGYGSHAFFLAYEASSDLWIKLDVVTDLAFGPRFSLRTGAEGACLSRRRRIGATAVLADEDAFWCLLLHRLLDKGELAPAAAGDLTRLAAAPCADSPLARVVDAVAPAGWRADRIVEAVRRGRWRDLADLAPALIAEWTNARRADVWRRRARGSVLRRMGTLLRRHRGMTVALLGPDGAGKSTAAAAIAGSFYFPVRVMYMSPGQPAPRWRPPGLGIAMRLSAQLTRWLWARSHTARGRLVLFDRYAFDALLPARRPLSRPSRLRRWVLGRACPPPDLTVVVDAPGELLYARKGEHGAAVLEAERRAYLALSRRLPRASVVDGTRDADQVRRDITATIWQAYRRRWDGRRDGPR
jgi:thymidylate kinase